MRFVRFIVYPCVRRNPVHFPSLASIVGEGLFETAGIWSDIRDKKTNKDRSAIEYFLVQELAVSILEFADCGLAQGTAVAAGKIETPLVGLAIVQAQGESFDVTFGTINVEFHHVDVAVPHFSHDSPTVVFDPGSGAS
jgi:hypothetical protein